MEGVTRSCPHCQWLLVFDTIADIILQLPTSRVALVLCGSCRTPIAIEQDDTEIIRVRPLTLSELQDQVRSADALAQMLKWNQSIDAP